MELIAVGRAIRFYHGVCSTIDRSSCNSAPDVRYIESRLYYL